MTDVPEDANTVEAIFVWEIAGVGVDNKNPVLTIRGAVIFIHLRVVGILREVQRREEQEVQQQEGQEIINYQKYPYPTHPRNTKTQGAMSVVPAIANVLQTKS